MNVVLSNFQIKIVALSVLMVLSPTVALSNNTHYMDGNVHEIGDFSTNEAFYVQNNTTVSAKDIEATVKVGVEGGSSLTANSIKTNTFLIGGGSTLKTNSFTLADNGQITGNSTLIITDGILKSNGPNTITIGEGSVLAKDENGTALDRIELAKGQALDSSADLKVGSFTGAYRGKNGVTFHVGGDVAMTGTIDLEDGSKFVADGDITYGGGYNFVSNTANGVIRAGGNIVFNGKGTFASKDAHLTVYANKFILNNASPNQAGNHNIYGDIHVKEVIADSITNSNFWQGLNVETLTLRNSTEGNFQVGASSTIGTVTVEEGSQNTIETFSSSADTKTKMTIGTLNVRNNATAGFTVTAITDATNLGSHDLEVGKVILAEGASFANTRRGTEDRKVGYENLYVGSIEAKGDTNVNLDYGVTHVGRIDVADNSTLTIGASGKIPTSVSEGTLSSNDDALGVMLNENSVLKLNSATSDDTMVSIQTDADAGSSFEIGAKSKLTGEKVSVTGLDTGASGDLQNDLSSLAQVVQKDGKVLAGVSVTQQATDIYDGGSAITTDDGGLTDVKVAPHANINGIAEMTALGLHIWRNEINDMNKRLGELRDSSADANGVWARVYNGKAKFGNQAITNKYTAFQFGYDHQVADGTWLGGALSWTDGNNDFAVGGGDSSLLAFTGYGSKLWDNGMFLDVTGKVGRMKNEFDISLVSGKSSASYHTNAVSVSAEAGWRLYPMQNSFYVEPQVELMYGHVFGVDYSTSTGVNVEQDSADTLIGRAGVVLGLKCPDNRGNAYLRASVLHDWKGDADFTFSKTAGAARTISEELGGTWYEYGIGANFNATKQVHLYADVEAANGGEVDTDYRVNFGVRYSY